MNNKTHAKFSASGSHRWFHCPGSIRECEKAPPSKSSKFAEEGTHAHAIAEKILNGEVFQTLEEGLAENVRVYTDYVFRKAEFNKLLVEQKFHLDFIHPDLFGTNDACIINPMQSLEIVDLKYGAGVPVEVEDNSQLLIYAIGALWNKELNKLDDEFDTITCTIVQPRCPHPDGVIRSKTYKFSEVQEFVETLKQKVKDAEDPLAPLVSGEHCRWCPAASICSKLHQETKEIIAQDFDDLPKVPEMSEEQVIKVVKAKKKIEAFLDACEESLFENMTNGKVYEGLQLTRGRGSRKWALPEEEIASALHKLGFTHEELFVKEMRSIAQMEKFKKQIPDDLICKMEGALKLEVINEKKEKKQKQKLINDF